MDIEQLKNIVSKINGVTFCSMDTVTNVALKGGKKNPHQGRVTKATSNNQIMIFTNQNSNGYENMVKRRLEAEGKDPDAFQVGPLPWGKRIPGTPLIEHNDSTYIQVIFNKGGNSTYLLDGVPVDESRIEGLPEKKITAPESELLSEENKVILRTFNIENIKSIRIFGEELHV